MSKTARIRSVLVARPNFKPKKSQTSIRQVGIRATEEWAGWLERAAAFCRTDTSKLIDAALVDYLKAKGFDEPAPPRL